MTSKLWQLAILRLRVRLGRGCIELHCGNVLRTLSLLLLAIKWLHRELGQDSGLKTVS